MPKRIKPLTKAHREAIDIIAHLVIVADLEKQSDMKGFAEHYMSIVSPKSKQIKRALDKAYRQALKDMVPLLEASKTDA